MEPSSVILIQRSPIHWKAACEALEWSQVVEEEVHPPSWLLPLGRPQPLLQTSASSETRHLPGIKGARRRILWRMGIVTKGFVTDPDLPAKHLRWIDHKLFQLVPDHEVRRWFVTIENLLFRSCAELLAEEKVLCRMATAIFTNQIESGILRRGFFFGEGSKFRWTSS